jgi:hypothetical protein
MEGIQILVKQAMDHINKLQEFSKDEEFMKHLVQIMITLKLLEEDITILDKLTQTQKELIQTQKEIIMTYNPNYIEA